MSRFRIVTVAAMTFTMLVIAWGLPAFAGLPTVTLGPTLNLSPDSTLPGKTVDVSGNGFPEGDPIKKIDPPPCSLSLKGGGDTFGTCQLDVSGTLSARFTLPTNAEPGSYSIIATADKASAVATLVVLKPLAVPNLRGLTSSAPEVPSRPQV